MRLYPYIEYPCVSANQFEIPLIPKMNLRRSPKGTSNAITNDYYTENNKWQMTVDIEVNKSINHFAKRKRKTKVHPMCTVFFTHELILLRVYRTNNGLYALYHFSQKLLITWTFQSDCSKV